MNLNFNNDGTLNRDNRPYYDQEETVRSNFLWDPHGNYSYGLYESSQPKCQSIRNQGFSEGHFNNNPHMVTHKESGEQFYAIHRKSYFPK